MTQPQQGAGQLTTPRTQPQPIAIVGMSCRFPGANNADELWELLSSGTDATSETPASRYNTEDLYSDYPALGKVSSRRAGYLSDIDQFDARFFGLSAGEAENLDPQQRLLMMTAWEAFEDAGMPPDRVAGTRTGVYVGSMHLDYWDLIAQRGLRKFTPFSIYNYRSVLSGRLAYTFDLRGPCITVDTACSSSLVAVHLACQSLRAGETTLAIAAGVNLKLTADEDVLLSQAGTLAPDGRCKFGDASADGFAASDGVGVVVLKPLAQALADNDRVRAVVLGSAIGNDGASSNSLLTPSVEGQIEMLRWAYADAGIDPADVDFIEAHGTGTPLIDPAEFAGLAAVLGKERSPDHPCFVGSIKTNIGHTEGAAGIAGLIKTVLCLEHHQVVPSLHYNTPNPAIPWDDLPLIVPTTVQSLPTVDRPAIAGISGQGISSANTHLVIGQADARWVAPRSSAQVGQAHTLVVSAHTSNALDDLARAYIRHLGPEGIGREFELRDVCYTAANRRHHHAYRLAITAADHDALIIALGCFLDRTNAPGLAVGHVSNPDLQTGRRLQAGQQSNLPLDHVAVRYVTGQPIDWSVLAEPGARFVPAPTYPWQTERYWLEPDPRISEVAAPTPEGVQS